MTLVGKAKLDHPALGTAGGSVLHAAIENLWERVSDHLPARWQLFESVANGATVSYEHGLKVPFGDLRVHLYLKGATSNTKVADPGAAGWSIVATSGEAQTKLDVTAPPSGGPFDFYLYVSHEPMSDKLDLSGGTMTGTLVLSGDPTQDLHAATKRYVDSIAQGLDPKASVKVATTANIGLSGTMTIDGVAVDAGDRVLVKDQTTASQNGIYVVGDGAWSRAADMDSWAEVPGAFVFVEQGTANADKGFVCTADQGGTIGSTAVSWVQFAGVGTVTSGSGGVNISANAVSLNLSGSTLDQTSGLKVADGGIGTAQLAGSIPDSKLATISTAGKVANSATTATSNNIVSSIVARDVAGSTAVNTLFANNVDVTGLATMDRAYIDGASGTGFMEFKGQTVADIPAPTTGEARIFAGPDGRVYVRKKGSASAEEIGGGGTVDKITQAAHGLAVGDVVYLNGSTYTKALNTAASTAEVVGVVSRVDDTNAFELTLSGEISGLVAGSYVDAAGAALASLPAAGEAVFLSHVAGKLTLVEPTVVGSVSVPIGVTSGSGTLYVVPKRGVVVGGANARTQLTLANNTTATIQNVSAYDAGALAGWIFIDATTDYRFYVQAQFVKGADNNYDVSYQTSGDTPPAGFSLSMTNAGLLQYTMPNLAGFNATNSVINYALNAPAVGTNFPLSVDASAVTSGTISAARLPAATATTAGTIPYYETGTWTPTIGASGTNFTSVTYGAVFGFYTQIGNLMTVNFVVQWTNTTGTPTSGLRVGGLPKAPATNIYASVGCECSNIVTPSASTPSVVVTLVGSGSTQIAVNAVGNGVGAVNCVAASNGGATVRYITASFSYLV